MGSAIKYRWYFGIFFFVWLMDWVIKYFVLRLALEQEMIFGIFKIGKFINPRGLFGAVGITTVTIISIVVFALIVFMFSKSNTEKERIALLLIFSGGSVNLAERIRFSFVTDSFALIGFGYFNFADLVIIAGTIILVGNLILRKRLLDLVD